jgi:hypothetical protein
MASKDISDLDKMKPKAFIEEWFFKKGHTPGDWTTRP